MRILKDNGCIVLTAQPPFDKVLASSNLDMFKYEWIWEKNKATGHLNSKKAPMKAHENVLIFYKELPVYNPQMTNGHSPMNYAKNNHSSNVYGKGKSTVNRAGATNRFPRDVIYIPVVNNDDPDKHHSTQKPVALFEYFIRTYSNEGDLILDNCCGSGTTALAAVKCGRNFICMDNGQCDKEKSIYYGMYWTNIGEIRLEEFKNGKVFK